MTNYEIKSVLAFLIFNIFSWATFAQSINETILLADSLYENNDLLNADTTFDRILFLLMMNNKKLF